MTHTYRNLTQAEVVVQIKRMRRLDRWSNVALLIATAPVIWLLIRYADPTSAKFWFYFVAYVFLATLVSLRFVKLECPRCTAPLSGQGRFSIGTLNYAKCPRCGVDFPPERSTQG